MTVNIHLLDDLIRESREQQKQTQKQKQKQKEDEIKARRLKAERAKYLPYTAAIEDDNWIPQFTAIQVIRQECCECGQVTEFIGAISTHGQHKRLKAWREINSPTVSDLPKQVRYHHMKTPVCAHCLRVEKIVDDFFVDSACTQMELF